MMVKKLQLLLLAFFSALLLLLASAAPAPYQHAFVRRPSNIEKLECFTIVNRIVILKRYKLVKGLPVIYNVTIPISRKKCCQGYKMIRAHCMRVDPVNPCQALSCPSEPNAKCTIFKKCGKEIALFMDDGSVLEKCHEQGYLDVLSCSGVCVGDPCLNANCLAFNASEVICFTSGCDCQVTWIRVQDRAEVNCQTGAVLTKQESSNLRRRREACT